MAKKSPALLKESILEYWLSLDAVREILQKRNIDSRYLTQNHSEILLKLFYDNSFEKESLQDSAKVDSLLEYLKLQEVDVDELFELFSSFGRAISTQTSKQPERYSFDKNFRMLLKLYTDAIYQKLIDAKQEAIRAGEAKEYFLSNMSHEIRTPLNAILGFVNLLIEEKLSKKQRHYLEIILSSGENLLSIINDILDFSKLRSGEFSIEPKLFSLHEELSHTLELFVASANAKDITLLSYIDPKIPAELYGDALRIKQIISNFLSNAVKFTPKGGLVEVEASYKNGILKVSVSDNGVGIDVFDLKKVFTAFAQAQYAKEKNEGTGLGLSISYQLAELMNGKVEVASVLGSGSTFWMEIPIEVAKSEVKKVQNIEEYQKLSILLYTKDKELNLKHESLLQYAKDFNINIQVTDNLDSDFDLCFFVDDAADTAFIKNIREKRDKKFIALTDKECERYEDDEHINTLAFPLYCTKIERACYELFHPQEKQEKTPQSVKRFKGHILVAEDNEANQELIKIILEKYGLTYDVANNGLEAYELYKQKQYDLILMDEQMPVMDGTESVRKIIEYEESQGLQHTPISALTANVIKGAKERGLLVGFDAFLGKPVVLKELERIFLSYLQEDIEAQNDIQKRNSIKIAKKAEIEGLDVSKLTKELMLTKEELTFLLDLFLKKMKKALPELEASIKKRAYKEIALKAHSIKGSSGNFRIEELLKYSQEMEMMARQENREYDYEETFQKIEQKIASISVVST